LGEKFDEETEINPFYKSFKEKLPQYEAENKDAVDVLYTFIDFSKFKEQILEIKRAQNIDTKDKFTNSADHFEITSVE